jgi:class 3 adenylate cyclase
VFEHLRTLQRNLQDYLPRLVVAASAAPGQAQHAWQEGRLMFTDLAGFTPLLEANMARGAEGAAALLQVLSRYFAAMIEIVSKAGGSLLKFTGDAMLAMFPADKRRNPDPWPRAHPGSGGVGWRGSHVARAVRAKAQAMRSRNRGAEPTPAEEPARRAESDTEKADLPPIRVE